MVVSKNICMHLEIMKEVFLSVIFDAKIFYVQLCSLFILQWLFYCVIMVFPNLFTSVVPVSSL